MEKIPTLNREVAPNNSEVGSENIEGTQERGYDSNFESKKAEKQIEIMIKSLVLPEVPKRMSELASRRALFLMLEKPGIDNGYRHVHSALRRQGPAVTSEMLHGDVMMFDKIYEPLIVTRIEEGGLELPELPEVDIESLETV